MGKQKCENLTLEKYLSARLNAPSDEGFSFGGILSNIEGIVQNREAYTAAAMIAAGLDFEDAITQDENFSIRPLPIGSYTEDQIVSYVKEFYQRQGFRYNEDSSNLSWWATLSFDKTIDRELLVTLSTYPMHGKDTENDELLVTTEIDNEMIRLHESFS